MTLRQSMDFKKMLLSSDPFPDILGQQQTKQQLKSALLMSRHVLIIGAPGIGKTTLAKNVASMLKKNFVRIQGSPDLTAEDLLGDIDPIKAMKFGPLDPKAFTPGKIFKADKGILFFDEVNRCPEKLQNALLQVLEEGKATLGSYTVDFPANFVRSTNVYGPCQQLFPPPPPLLEWRSGREREDKPLAWQFPIALPKPF